ncbi:hypothetical protein SEMRO_2244_G320490.1 [Seminavis robusta]|uniref:Uncharacterized protein n=1 Tax=Seminavis robusta TaxID=568900 RepID=A0A9N8HWQ7_9STRA|nr:hypothetical protein SEMRO_2244_G320490.1 [Seminavis robusta]|eukprot:Sro2244_g320490.1 n/a (185) ;mRNA; f:1223-1777
MKATPTLEAGIDNLALESPETPTAMRFFVFGEQETGANDGIGGEQRRKRLDFGSPFTEQSAVSRFASGGFGSPLVEAIHEEDEDSAVATTENSFHIGTQTDLKSRLEAEIRDHCISRDCEEEICRALYHLFQSKAVPISRSSTTDENEVLTIRQVRKGSSIKILRIKESRHNTKKDIAEELRPY